MDKKGNNHNKKRILYVDRRYPEWSSNRSSPIDIARALDEQYDVTLRYDLGDETVSLVEKVLVADPFKAMLTHVPYDNILDLDPISKYEKSFSILKKIKELAGVPVIAYTGANIETKVFLRHGIDFNSWSIRASWLYSLGKTIEAQRGAFNRQG